MIIHVFLEITTRLGLAYLIVKNSKKSWSDARADCEERGYKLASVLSAEETHFLEDYA